MTWVIVLLCTSFGNLVTRDLVYLPNVAHNSYHLSLAQEMPMSLALIVFDYI